MTPTPVIRKSGSAVALRVALTLGLALAAAHARADVISVNIDQAKVIELPDSTSTIIIGNPVVADITMLKGRGGRMILTGKSFGTTNLIALDAAGNAIGESTIRVTGDFKGLIVQRGMDRESYDCSPRCHPTINLGDSGKFMGETAGAIGQHNTLMRGK